MKEILIREYISSIDFKGDNWKLSEILTKLFGLVGETPAVDISYKKDLLLNEGTKEAKEIKKVDKLSIVFTDDNNKFKKIEFIL